ncbi:hypothetical protein HNR25_001495 [Streptomonospora salina]|uniref:Uncharacterized protein n=1 Tax=Streptomonospora salina TaxID=104205 RepID=A0A841E5L8_9ACTN|nr:hypothetical protein [Streptomonospora salina]
MRIESFNLTGASAVLLLTAIAVCIVAVRARAQTVFARHISGWTFLATHRRFLAVEAAIALGFVGWFTWDTPAALQARRTAAGRLSELTTPGFEPLYAAGIAAVGLALAVGALAVFHRRIVREGASQACPRSPKEHP